MITFSDQVVSALASHGEWIAKLHQAVASGGRGFKVATVRKDNRCDFGKWLYGEGKVRFPKPGDHERVRLLHAEFHAQAAKVLELATFGDKAGAEKAMATGGDFSRASSKLVLALWRADA